MTQDLLLLHERPSAGLAMTPAEMKEKVGRYKACAGQLAAQGKLAGGEKLTDDGGRSMLQRRRNVLAQRRHTS